MSRKRYHPVLFCPLLIMHAWVIDHVIGQMRALFASNPAYLQISDWDPAICPIQPRVSPGARLQLQHAFILVQQPNSCEGGVEVTNDSLSASVQYFPKVGRFG